MNPSFSYSPKLEKDLDLLIRRNMKGESFFSPLNFSPAYQQDPFSRVKLKGYRGESGYYPSSYQETVSTSNPRLNYDYSKKNNENGNNDQINYSYNGNNTSR